MAESKMLPDNSFTRLIIFEKSVYEKYFAEFDFSDVPILLYRHISQFQAQHLSDAERTAVSKVPNLPNTFEVELPIVDGTLFSRDVTPFTVVSSRRRYLVTFHPWVEFDDISTWLGESRGYGSEETLQTRRARRVKSRPDLQRQDFASTRLADIILANQQLLFGRRVFHGKKHLPLNIEGGSLVVDGKGTCFVSRQLFFSNSFDEPQHVRKLLTQVLGCQRVEVVSVHPSVMAAGHVDMVLAVRPDGRLVYYPDGTNGDIILDESAIRLPSEFNPVQFFQMNGAVYVQDFWTDSEQPGSVSDYCERFLNEGQSVHVVKGLSLDRGGGPHCMSGQIH